MVKLTVDPEKCNRDGICALECPPRIITMPSKSSLPEQASNFEEYCLRCGHCVAVCPTEALSLDWLNPEDCPQAGKEGRLDASLAEQFLRARRSYRSYKDKAIEREKLEKLLEIACYAPSAKNRQAWRWTVVETPSETKRMVGMVIDWMRSVMKEHPAAAEQRGFTRAVEGWDKGEDRICRGAPTVIVAHCEKNYAFGAEDSALALCYLDLYAPSLDLGACWGGYFYSAVNSYPPLFEALGIPQEHKAFGAIMVGYPKFTYHRLPLRNDPRVTWI